MAPGGWHGRSQRAVVTVTMDSRWWRQGGEAVDQLQRGKELWAAVARAGFAGGVEQVLGIALLQPFQGERRTGAVAQQALPPGRSVAELALDVAGDRFAVNGPRDQRGKS